MIDLSRERVCKPVLKLDFTDYGIMETLWSSSQKLDSAYCISLDEKTPARRDSEISDYWLKTDYQQYFFFIGEIVLNSLL
jgi:hypothetical protein